MTRLKKIADNNKELNLKLSQYILDILVDDVQPIITSLDNSGIGYGVDEVKKLIVDLKDEYYFISKKAQEMSKATDISYYCNEARKKCQSCKDQIDKWNESYTCMPTETEDDRYEKESYEYQADKLVTDLMKELVRINIDIETEAEQVKTSLTKESNIKKVSTDYNGSSWYNNEDNDLLELTVKPDGSVYGCGNEFDFDAKDINEALTKLKRWNYYQL